MKSGEFNKACDKICVAGIWNIGELLQALALLISPHSHSQVVEFIPLPLQFERKYNILQKFGKKMLCLFTFNYKQGKDAGITLKLNALSLFTYLWTSP